MVVDLTVGIILVLGGIILLALELVHPGVLLIIPGTILLVAGFLYLAFPNFLLDEPWGTIVVILGTMVATFAELQYLRMVAPTHRPLSTTSSGLVGEVGIVVAPVVPNTLKGKVRIKSEIWSARADTSIPAGVHVRVVHGEGVSVTVQPVDTPRAG